MSPRDKVRTVLGAVGDIGLFPTVSYYWNWFRGAIGMPRKEVLQLQPKGIPYPVTLRGGGSSDSSVFRQIFIEREYLPLYNTPSVKFVLDLGANIGLSAVAFLTQFPDAQVVALEPDEENYRLCCENLAPFGKRARAIRGAVWARPAKLALTRTGDGREWGVTVVEPQAGADGEVQSWDPQTLFEMAGFETVDLLKIDIEGSEAAIFNGDAAEWIPRVRNLCIELHGPNCNEAFYGAMSGFEYEKEHSGELVICRNIRIRSA